MPTERVEIIIFLLEVWIKLKEFLFLLRVCVCLCVCVGCVCLCLCVCRGVCERGVCR